MNQTRSARLYNFNLLVENSFFGHTLVLALALFTTGTSASTLFKCRDNGGQIYYQDHDCLISQSVTRWEMKAPTSARITAATKPANQAGAFVVVLANQYNAYRLPGLINDIPVELIVDTGASLVSIPMKVAEKLKVGCASKVPLHTANGTTLACTGMVRSLQIGSLLLNNIDVLVLPNDESSLVLLGGSALKHLKVVQLKGEMRLSTP